MEYTDRTASVVEEVKLAGQVERQEPKAGERHCMFRFCLTAHYEEHNNHIRLE